MQQTVNIEQKEAKEEHMLTTTMSLLPSPEFFFSSFLCRFFQFVSFPLSFFILFPLFPPYLLH